MKINKVIGLFFSPTGNTKIAVKTITETIASQSNTLAEYLDFTLPQQRTEVQEFSENDLVIVGVPVYAGRIPNKILPYIQSKLIGNSSLVIPIVTYGNRSFDNALKELSHELTIHGFTSVAGVAVPSQHAFSSILASHRPNQEDKELLKAFANQVSYKVQALDYVPNTSISFPGDEIIDTYYTPLGMDGQPAKFLKAKPKTNIDLCTSCGICATHCPMQAISFMNFIDVPGTCIKCQACIQKCPTHAKFFDDEAFLSHVKMLEQTYTRRLEIQCFY